MYYFFRHLSNEAFSLNGPAKSDVGYGSADGS